MVTQESDLDHAVLLSEFRSQSLYNSLLSMEDERGFVHPGFVERRKELLELVVEHNPLARAIVQKEKINSTHDALYLSDFNGVPISCFGLHEILRKTRFNRDFADASSPGKIQLGDRQVTHDQLLEWYKQLIPNLNLNRVYNRSPLLENPVTAPLLAGTLTSFIVGQESEAGQMPSIILSGAIGAILTAGAIWGVNRKKYGRNLTKTAPWNSSMYVDTNLALLRDNPEQLYLASRAAIPRPTFFGFKTKPAYYALAHQILNGSYISGLKARHDLAKNS